MRKISTLILALCVCSAYAQPIISSGNPLTGINGTTYDSVAATGNSLYGSVANTQDGKLFATHNGKVKFINALSFAVMDSMDLAVNYFTGSLSIGTMFGLKNNGTLCRFNVVSKTLTDSLPLAGQYHARVAERPGSKEVWVGGAPITVVDHTSTMTAGATIPLGTNIINIKFSSDGAKAYANSGVTNRIYMIDAATKAVTDSMSFNESPASFVLSNDNSKLFVTATGKVRVYQLSTKAAIDSVMIAKPVMSMYNHPKRAEIWCVHHFNNMITVLDANTYQKIDTINVGGSPFFLAFGQVPEAVHTIANSKDVKLYPNPANDVLYVNAATNIAAIQIYDLKGALLQEQTVNAKHATLHVPHLPHGQYLLRLRDTEGVMRTASFIK